MLRAIQSGKGQHCQTLSFNFQHGGNTTPFSFFIRGGKASTPPSGLRTFKTFFLRHPDK
jgi:hypothetical protein